MSVRIPVNSFGSGFSGSSVSQYNTKELDLKHTDKLYNNTTGYSLAGDLNLNGNRIYLNNNKKQSIYENSENIVFEIDNKFIVKNNINNTLKFLHR